MCLRAWETAEEGRFGCERVAKSQRWMHKFHFVIIDFANESQSCTVMESIYIVLLGWYLVLWVLWVIIVVRYKKCPIKS